MAKQQCPGVRLLPRHGACQGSFGSRHAPAKPPCMRKNLIHHCRATFQVPIAKVYKCELFQSLSADVIDTVDFLFNNFRQPCVRLHTCWRRSTANRQELALGISTSYRAACLRVHFGSRRAARVRSSSTVLSTQKQLRPRRHRMRRRIGCISQALASLSLQRALEMLKELEGKGSEARESMSSRGFTRRMLGGRGGGHCILFHKGSTAALLTAQLGPHCSTHDCTSQNRFSASCIGQAFNRPSIAVSR